MNAQNDAYYTKNEYNFVLNLSYMEEWRRKTLYLKTTDKNSCVIYLTAERFLRILSESTYYLNYYLPAWVNRSLLLRACDHP